MICTSFTSTSVTPDAFAGLGSTTSHNSETKKTAEKTNPCGTRVLTRCFKGGHNSVLDHKCSPWEIVKIQGTGTKYTSKHPRSCQKSAF